MPSHTLHYLHLDVFTDRLFGGNQLAVYLDPSPGLPDATMLAIAREMAFSETTFVFPPAEPGIDSTVRIFTPARELPMAGHPTVGTAFALAHAGRVAPGTQRIVFREGVGPVPLDLEWKDARLDFAWMTQPRPVFGPVIDDVTGFCAAINVAAADLRPNAWPLQEVSCGVAFIIVPVASRAALDRAVPDARGHARAFEEAGLPQGHVYLFTREPGPDGADVYTRMFAPDIGIVEDAATGSAAGPLGAYLVRHGIVRGDRPIRALQGVAMGRPSWIHIAPVLEGATIAAMRVGGQAALAGEGTIVLPE